MQKSAVEKKEKKRNINYHDWTTEKMCAMKVLQGKKALKNL